MQPLCRGKTKCITYYESVFVAIVTQLSKHAGHIILTSVAFPAVQHFSTFSHKWHYFGKKVIERKMCFDFPYCFCQKYFTF